MCKELKLENEFNKNSHKKDGLQDICRLCNKTRAKRYYKENQSYHRNQVNLRKRKLIKQNQEKMWGFLLKSSCVDCGNNNPLVLEFDHFRDKENGVCQLLCGGSSWERVLKEIEKCEIRCANCHNIKTHREKNTYRWKKFGNTLLK